MRKFLKWVLILTAFSLVISFFSADDSSNTATRSAPTTESNAPVSKPAIQRPNVEFAYGFKYVKLRVYSCAPCSESQATSAANILAESGKVTAHAFFQTATDFKALESKIAGAGSFVKAEEIIKEAGPKQFRRVMANGVTMDY